MDHVGPHVVGVRASISDDDRDNATMLYDFLQSHNFTLPQTFTQLPCRQSVSYKETTCSDHLLAGDNPRDWTTLDYLMCPPSLREVLSFRGSIFQQAINSRHLPLSFNLRTRYLPVSKTSLPPKKDYRSMSDFYGLVEHSLLASTDNSFLLPPFLTIMSLLIPTAPAPITELSVLTIQPDGALHWYMTTR